MSRSPHPLLLAGGTMAWFAAALSVTSIFRILLLGAVLLIGVVVARVHWRVIALTVYKTAPFIIFVFCFHLFLGGTAEEGARWHCTVGRSSLLHACLFSSRMLLMVVAITASLHAHPPQAYAREFGRVMARLGRGGRIMGQIELMTTLAMRFIPLLMGEYGRILLAFRARGMQSGDSMIARLQRARRILFPLAVNAFLRAEQVAIALEARGYNPSVKRTYLRACPLRVPEAIGTMFFICACLLIVVL